jgi:hypothetical protein
MRFADKIKSAIDRNKSIEEQLDKLAQFDNLSDNDINELTKLIKSTEAGILIDYLGFEKLIKYLPKFLEFLQDMNWPAAGGAAKMLTKSGRLILPEIKRVFNEVANDGTWHYWIILEIIKNWKLDLIKEVKPDLIQLIERADFEGASIQALKILKGKDLLTNEKVRDYYQFLLEIFAGNEYLLQDLKEEITCC